MTKHLVLTDIDAVQQYVFSSIRMATIVGASRIVDSFDRTLETTSGAATAVLNGGNGLFVFEDEQVAGDFAARVVQEFSTTSVNGTLTASHVVSYDSDVAFQAAIREALASLEVRKRLGHDRAETPDVGLAWQCEYCGTETALPMVVPIDGGRRIGAACLAKLQKRDSDKRKGPRDFNELAGDDYLAVMVIDGDGLGQRLHAIDTLKSYEDFSTNLKACIDRAVQAGLGVAKSCGASPFEILYQGGDDIVIACPSRWAFPFAEAFTTALAQEDWDWAGEQGRVGFSIGIAVTHSGFPFRLSHRIANRLLANAKRVAKDKGNRWPEGAIDFAIVTESTSDAETILEDRVAGGDGHKIHLSGRPYRLAVAGDENSQAPVGSLSRLREACEALRGFPRNRLYVLRNALSASRLAEGASSVPVVDTLRKDIAGWLQSWEERVDRDPALKSKWHNAGEHLPISDEVFPQGDLADASYLWENSLGDQD